MAEMGKKRKWRPIPILLFLLLPNFAQHTIVDTIKYTAVKIIPKSNNVSANKKLPLKPIPIRYRKIKPHIRIMLIQVEDKIIIILATVFKSLPIIPP